MKRQQMRAARVTRRRWAAAVNLALVGLLLVVLPRFVSNTMFAAAFKPLATIGWGMLLLVGIGAWVWRQKAAPPSDTDSWRTGPTRSSPRPARRPSQPVPPLARLTPEPPVTDTATPERPDHWSPRVFAAIEWRRFEAVVEALFAQAGFVTKAQSHGPDDGIDIWLYSKSQTDGVPVSLVQCKHWGKRIGVDKVRELRGVMAAKGVTRGQFATTSVFTQDAVAFAAGNGIKLHDGAGLLGLIAKRSPEQQQALLAVALEGDYWRPTCVKCGMKMIERTPSAGGASFWGCVNFPKCRTTMALVSRR